MNIINRDKKSIIQTYKRNSLVILKGKGAYVWDNNGKKYLDFFAGLSVCNVGHCHPGVISAIKKQADKLLHTSNLYYTEPQVTLAEMLIKRSFPGKVFFSNSGAEANECAIKLARKWGKQNNGSGKDRYEIITFKNSFHGRTMATISATGQEKFHKGFEPMLRGFKYAKFNDIESVKKIINKLTTAIIIEPVLGEGGVHPAEKEFLKQLRAVCDKNKLLLIFDEIQTGIGRTGKLFAYQNYGVKPDIITAAKSLGGGLPIGITIANLKTAGLMNYGDHGSTFGGNLISCSAAVEVLKILTPNFLGKSVATGKYFISGLKELAKKYPFIVEVRGIGLMIGVELDCPGKDIVQYCQDEGLLINCTQDKVLRFLPPLIIGRNEVQKALGILENAFKNFKVQKT